MTHTAHSQYGAFQKAETTESSLAELEDRYQRAKDRLLAASDDKLLAMEEFLTVGSALRRLLKTLHAAEQ